MALTDKQEVFLRLLVENQKRTGRDRVNVGRLYEKAGYLVAGDRADQNASRLIKNEKFQKEYSKELKKLRKKIEVSVADVLQEEKRLAFQDIIHLFKDKKSTITPPCDLPEDIRKAISSIKIIKKTSPTGIETTEYEYRFWDKGKALERLSKHLGLYEKDNRRTIEAGEELKEILKEISGETRGLPNKTQGKIKE